MLIFFFLSFLFCGSDCGCVVSVDHFLLLLFVFSLIVLIEQLFYLFCHIIMFIYLSKLNHSVCMLHY